jgi:hypothetical protein
MNREWFGDSYDIVKRFFVRELRSLGYRVYVDPMPSGEWGPIEPAFLTFLGALHIREAQLPHRSALFLDPDTGIADRPSRTHVSIARIIGHLKEHEIVFVFDQSFARAAVQLPQLQAKLANIQEHGGHAFYYDSHARFLFASLSSESLDALRNALLEAGLPEHRLVQVDTHDV